MEDNEQDDFNNEVKCNNPEDASKDCDMTIHHGESSMKEKRIIIAKICGTGVLPSLCQFFTQLHFLS